MIYISSDLHFGHDKPFLYEPRGFNNIEEHDRAIIKNWNSIVEWDDEVIVLGDIMLNDNINGRKCWNQLNGHKTVVLGNHDSNARVEILEQAPRTEILGYGAPYKYKNYQFFLSHYPCLVSNYDADKPLKTRVINLCGHCHTKDRWKDFDKGLIYHCELDAHNNYPIALDKIIEEIKEKVYGTDIKYNDWITGER